MNNWQDLIKKEFSKDYFKNIVQEISKERTSYRRYPPKEQLFTAFALCPINQTKAVILGMDPYHGLGQAHGLSFSVKPGVKVPPSLQNIFKELKSDLNIEIPKHGHLKSWAEHGVLLLNTALTVREGEPGSHMRVWEPFTKRIIKILNSLEQPIVFIFWGAHARKQRYLITNEKHLILESVHPSPLSAYNGFFGSKPFSRTNEFLIANNIEPINWNI